MTLWTQHLLVLLLVGLCCAYCLRGAISTLVGRKGRIGSCCAKGCPPVQKNAKLQADSRTHFLPAELLKPSKTK